VKLFGLDPGSSHAACAGLDAAASRPRLIASRTWSVGHTEALAEPRPYMQKTIAGEWVPSVDPATGLPRMRTHRHAVTLAEAESVARAIVAWLVEHGATHLLIERVDRVAPGETIGATTAMATGIAHAAELGAIASALAANAGIQVATTTRQHAHGVAIGGSIKGRGKRAEETLSRDVDGWDDRPREGTGEERRADHERDATVCALAAVRILRGEQPPPKPKKVRRDRAPRAPLTPEQEAARAERYRKRLEAIERKKLGIRLRKPSHAAEREAAVLAELRASAEPLATSELSRRTGIGDDRVSDALAVLGKRGEAVRVGRAWRAASAPAT